jgi:putative heme-binding domain-containing protein
VAANYVAYDVALRDGGTQTGLLGDETLTHVRIKLPLGKELLLPRTQVKSMRSGGKSIMPEGLEAGLTPQQVSDLVAFIVGL